MKYMTSAAVGSIALGLFLSARPVRAQTPIAAATPLPPWTTRIPELVPENWKASTSQATWTALRRHCIDIISELNRRHHLTDAQLRAELKTLVPISHNDAEQCLNLDAGFQSPSRPYQTPGPTMSPTIMQPPRAA